MKNKFYLLTLCTLFSFSSFAQTALSFTPAESDYVSIPPNNALQITGDATVEAWVSITNTSGLKAVFINCISPDFWGLFLNVNNGKAGLNLDVSGVDYTVNGTTTLTTNVWHHIAGVRNGTTLLIYLDGVLDGTNTFPGGLLRNSIAESRIGKPQDFNTPLNFEGKIEEVRVWNIARTPAEIKENMFATASNSAGLVLYYKMNDGSGQVVTDLSATGLNGTLGNTAGADATDPAWVSSPIQNSPNGLAFDGTDDFVSTNNYVVPTSGDFTIEFWGYLNNIPAGFYEFVSQGSAGDALYIGVRNDGQMRLGDLWQTTGYTLAINQWTHIAVVRSGTNGILYINGTQQATTTGYGISAAGTAFNMGRQYGGLNDFLNGKMDELRVWNVVRTQTQILAGMTTEINPAETGLVSYFRINQGLTGGDNNGLTLLHDLTGNNNGTLANFALTGLTSNYVPGASIVTLAIQLLSFTANTNNGQNILNWHTSSEQNSGQFIVERSADRINFSLIGTVAAAGNSSTERSYSFTDVQPIPGTNFYRLKTIALDGAISYSKIVAVKMNGMEKGLVLFPNPVNNSLNVQVSANETATMQITDVSGKILKQQMIKLNGSTSFSIDVRDFKKGKYYLVLKLKDKKLVEEFIKL